MRVFAINTVYGSGSTGRIVESLKHELEAGGHACFVAYGRGTSDDANTLCVSSRTDLYRHALLTRLTDRHSFFSSGSTRRLIDRIRDFKPDVVHLHNLHGYYLNLQMLFEFLSDYGRPVIWTLHDCWSFTGHCTHFEYIGCKKWKSGCHDCPQVKEYPASWRVDASRRNYQDKKRLFTSIPDMLLVTPSAWLAAKVKESFLGGYAVRVVPNGIDAEAFRPAASDFQALHGLKQEKIALGVANPWRGRKGFEDFLRLPTLLGEGWRVVMVGLTDRQMSCLPEEIIGIQKTDSVAELAQIYTAADTFVNASYEETLPTVNIEALACGTPVVTYASGGSPETLDENCGVSVTRGDIQALANAIRTAEFPASACLKRAGCFDEATQCRQYLALYREALACQRASDQVRRADEAARRRERKERTWESTDVLHTPGG